jgi:hypothetical protein
MVGPAALPARYPPIPATTPATATPTTTFPVVDNASLLVRFFEMFFGSRVTVSPSYNNCYHSRLFASFTISELSPSPVYIFYLSA